MSPYASRYSPAAERLWNFNEMGMPFWTWWRTQQASKLRAARNQYVPEEADPGRRSGGLRID